MVNYNKKFGAGAELETVKTTDVGNLESELGFDLGSGPDMTAGLETVKTTDVGNLESDLDSDPDSDMTARSKAGAQMAAVVCPSHLNVRESANILSRVVAVLKPGDVVVIEDIQDDWTHIYISSGIEGYSLSEYIVPTPVE